MVDISPAPDSGVRTGEEDPVQNQNQGTPNYNTRLSQDLSDPQLERKIDQIGRWGKYASFDLNSNCY